MEERILPRGYADMEALYLVGFGRAKRDDEEKLKQVSWRNDDYRPTFHHFGYNKSGSKVTDQDSALSRRECDRHEC
jgi:hypothetical protein